ncbi:hypothetical protein [Virgibacillus siamensis]|uniref:hypothetical protein n=1 Tax=Virgibacillus siamensis TaxID=480071 RepID=UPI000985561A|nr:hypothetical protein [Virgibacillus siamensis]
MINWTDEKRKQIINLKNQNLTWAAISEQMSAVHDERYTIEQCRSQYRNNKDRLLHDTPQQPEPQYKSTFERKSDGTEVSDTLIKISQDRLKDNDYILKAHGYDPDEWEISSHQFSMWNHFNKEMDNPKVLYASKVKVIPKKDKFSLDKLLESVKQVPEVNIQPVHTREQSYLNIPLADMHFGIATYEDYKKTQMMILDLIQKGHEEILFIIGNDLLHHNDHRNRTASGREIQQVDIIEAWNNAKMFYYPLLEYALMHSNKVTVLYTKGNHSESMEWTFVQMLKERFTQIHFDDEFKERKVHMLGLNFAGSSHGDKKKLKNLTENFATEFPYEWSIASTRTVFSGHLHHELVLDKGGVIHRQLPSGVNPDTWHSEMGYTTSHRRFQVFEYDYESERCIYYV